MSVDAVPTQSLRNGLSNLAGGRAATGSGGNAFSALLGGRSDSGSGGLLSTPAESSAATPSPSVNAKQAATAKSSGLPSDAKAVSATPQVVAAVQDRPTGQNPPQGRVSTDRRSQQGATATKAQSTASSSSSSSGDDSSEDQNAAAVAPDASQTVQPPQVLPQQPVQPSIEPSDSAVTSSQTQTIDAAQPVSSPAAAQPISSPAAAQPVSSPAAAQPVSSPAAAQPISSPAAAAPAQAVQSTQQSQAGQQGTLATAAVAAVSSTAGQINGEAAQADAQAQSDAVQAAAAQNTAVQSPASPQLAAQVAQLSQAAGNTAVSVKGQAASSSSSGGSPSAISDLSSTVVTIAQSNGDGGSSRSPVPAQPAVQADAPQQQGADQSGAESQQGQAQAAVQTQLQAPPQAQPQVREQVKPGAEGGVEAVSAPSTPAVQQVPAGIQAVQPTQQGISFAQQLSQVQGTQTARPATLPSAVDQVKVQIDKGVATGSDTISVVLHPEELGRVEVKLEMSRDGLVKATVTADNAGTLQVLKNDSQSLQQSLQDAGLSADSNSLSFHLRSDQQAAQQQQQQSGGNGSQSQETLSTAAQPDDGADASLTAAALAAWTADPSDGLDIRV